MNSDSPAHVLAQDENASKPVHGDLAPRALSRPDYQQRVIDEKVQLDDKLAKLLAFFDTPTYAALATPDRLLLIAQHTHMRAYSDTLGTRIARFA